MIDFREDKCPLCGGKFKDGICYNGECALGQFTHYTYKDSEGNAKVVSAFGGVEDAPQEETTENA